MKNWPWYGNLIVAAALFALAFFVYFKPKNQEIANLRAERVRVEQEVQVLKQKKLELDKIEAEISTMNATLRQLEQIIPLRKEIAAILRQVQQLAYDARLDIVNFTPQGETNKEFYAEWAIPIEVTGSFHNLGIFFDRLSRFSRLFIVDRFSLRALPAQTDLATISAGFTAKTFIFTEEPKAPAPAPGRRP